MLYNMADRRVIYDNTMKEICAIAFLVAVAIAPCAAQQASPTPVPSSVQLPTGSAVGGLAMSLIANTEAVRLGEAIWVTVVVKNVSGQSHHGWLGPRGMYRFKIVNKATGTLVSLSGAPYGQDTYVGHMGTLDPNGTMQGRFRLDVMYAFKEPGTYTVQVVKSAATLEFTVPPLQSNVVTVSVLPSH